MNSEDNLISETSSSLGKFESVILPPENLVKEDEKDEISGVEIPHPPKMSTFQIGLPSQPPEFKLQNMVVDTNDVSSLLDASIVESEMNSIQQHKRVQPSVVVFGGPTEKDKNYMPVQDLTKSSTEPYVLCKVSYDVFNRLLKSKEKDKPKPNIIKGTWSDEEDKLLVSLVNKFGAKRWTFIASQGLQKRTGKQCRERYQNHLDPSINKTEFTQSEDDTIIELQAKHGNKWSLISKELPGRTPGRIKNRWNSTLKKKFKRSSE